VRIVLVAYALLSAALAHGQTSVQSELHLLFAQHEPSLNQLFAPAWQAALAHGLPGTPLNRDRFVRALFVWNLARADGVLGIRFEVHEDDGVHPDQLLRRAVGDAQAKPVRCDEIEMLSSALMKKVFGLPAEIKLISANHVMTEVPMDGGYLRLEGSLLSCFSFGHTPIPNQPPADGRYDIKRTNRIALRDLHENKSWIDAPAANRLQTRMRELIDHADAAGWYCRRQ